MWYFLYSSSIFSGNGDGFPRPFNDFQTLFRGLFHNRNDVRRVTARADADGDIIWPGQRLKLSRENLVELVITSFRGTDG